MEFIKNNKKYLLIFIACLLIMVVAIIPQYNFYHIIGNYLFNPSYHYFQNSDVFIPKSHHNIFELISDVCRQTPLAFDSVLEFGTAYFVFLLPFLPLIGCISFYSYYNRILKFELVKRTSLKKNMYKKMISNALKLSISVFIAYLCMYLITMLITWMPTNNNAPNGFLTDLLSSSFYFKHTYIYFLLDGFICFFYMPFVYAMLMQASVLVFGSFRNVLLTNIVYYFGLAAIGYVFLYINMAVGIHINPLSIMSSAEFEGINSVVMILVSSIPLFIAIGIIQWRSKYVEI